MFNIRLNNYREDTKNTNAILACRHFERQGHNFNRHIKFIIIDKLVNTSGSKDILREGLIQHKNFLIQKPKTLAPYGLNTKLQQTENEGPRAVFSLSFLPRPKHPSHLRTQIISQYSKIY